jgi:hypothetical protein
MDGSGGHYVKWNKPGTERQVPHDLTHMWNTKKGDLTEVESRIVVTRDWGKKVGEMGEGSGVLLHSRGF